MPKRVDRAFSSPIIEMALASYPGFFCTTPPTEASPFGVYWPTLVPADVPHHAVVLEDGTPHSRAADRPRPDNRSYRRAAAQAAGRSHRSDARARRWARCSVPARATRGAMPTSACGPATMPVYAWLASFLTRRAVSPARARGGGLGSSPLRVAELEVAQLRRRRPVGRRRSLDQSDSTPKPRAWANTSARAWWSCPKLLE